MVFQKRTTRRSSLHHVELSVFCVYGGSGSVPSADRLIVIRAAEKHLAYFHRFCLYVLGKGCLL